jgi:phytoene desaturase
VGGNPNDTPSIYATIHYLERLWGVITRAAGTRAIVDAMMRLFAELGGKLILNADVEEILTFRPAVKGIRLADGTKVGG